MNRLLEKIENLFVINRKQTTYTRAFISFIIVLAGVAVLPTYFKYEDYTYAKYKKEYDSVVEIVEQYNKEYGRYPLGEPINWAKEKNLNLFFTENKLSGNRELYYIDIKLLDELKNNKYTYIIDVQHGKLYTREFVVYKNRRWHFAFY